MNAKPDAMSHASALEDLTQELLGSYLGDERGRRISHGYLPSREGIVEILTSVLDLMYPGYFGRQDLNVDNLNSHVEHMLAELGRVADARLGAGVWSFDRVMRQIPDHFHAHARDPNWWYRRFSHQG